MRGCDAKTLMLITGLCGLARVAPAQEADSMSSLLDGAYTAEQAQRGERIYASRCASCHAPEFFTDGFLLSWSGATVRMLFEVIRTSMPEDRPGSLRPREYADVLAYIFALNGLPAGSRDLPSILERLDRILIERSP